MNNTVDLITLMYFVGKPEYSTVSNGKSYYILLGWMSNSGSLAR